LLGFVHAALRVNGLLDLGDSRELTNRRLHLTIRDPDAHADGAVLYRSFPSSESRHELEELRSEIEVTVANRSWLLTFAATNDYGSGHHGAVTWLVLAGGLVLSVLVGGGALILTGRTALVRSLVRERTEELAQINGKLAEEICDHVRTERELDSEKQFLATVLENLNEGILVFDLDNRITIENRAVKRIHTRITGQRRSADSWVGSHVVFAADGATPLALDDMPSTRALRGETLTEVQIVAVAKNRPAVTLMVNAHPLRDRDGEQTGAIVVLHDITDAQKAERLKREFVSVVSHELRTPLTSIRGSLGLVNGGVAGELPPKARRLIEIAYRNSDRLSMLINDILDMERIETGKLALTLQSYAITELLQQAIEAHQGYAAECQVQLSLLEVPADAAVQVDASRFQQVMANLLSNATKFSPRGAVVEVGSVIVDDQVRVFVRDRGPGIAAEFRPLLFKKFSQVDGSDTRAKSGTGLGLAISKGLIETMHGRIDYESQLNIGTTFFFDLPLQATGVAAAGNEFFTATGSVMISTQKSA
jgi:PAS domain S-box-containing protein